MHTILVCNKCGWHHFAVSWRYCLKWEEEWRQAWDHEYDEETKACYGNRCPNTGEYLKCQHCGNSYRDFCYATPEQLSDPKLKGCTLGPILHFAERP